MFPGLHRNKKAAPLVEGGASVTIKPTSSTTLLTIPQSGRNPAGSQPDSVTRQCGYRVRWTGFHLEELSSGQLSQGLEHSYQLGKPSLLSVAPELTEKPMRLPPPVRRSRTRIRSRGTTLAGLCASLSAGRQPGARGRTRAPEKCSGEDRTARRSRKVPLRLASPCEWRVGKTLLLTPSDPTGFDFYDPSACSE